MRSRRCGRSTPIRPGSRGSSPTTPTPTCWPSLAPRARARTASGGSLVFVANLSPVVRARATGSGCPARCRWKEGLNTDSTFYGGSDVGNLGGLDPEPIPWHNQPVRAGDAAAARGGVVDSRIAVSFTLSVPVEFGVAEYPWERPLGARPRCDGSDRVPCLGAAGRNRSRCASPGATSRWSMPAMRIYEAVTPARPGDEYWYCVGGQTLPDPCLTLAAGRDPGPVAGRRAARALRTDPDPARCATS